jgi:hypothetical protein
MRFENKIDASETVCVKMHLKEEAIHSEYDNTFMESAQEIIIRLSYCFQLC